jgi:hypothetical protein
VSGFCAKALPDSRGNVTESNKSLLHTPFDRVALRRGREIPFFLPSRPVAECCISDVASLGQAWHSLKRKAFQRISVFRD